MSTSDVTDTPEPVDEESVAPSAPTPHNVEPTPTPPQAHPVPPRMARQVSIAEPTTPILIPRSWGASPPLRRVIPGRSNSPPPPYISRSPRVRISRSSLPPPYDSAPPSPPRPESQSEFDSSSQDTRNGEQSTDDNESDRLSEASSCCSSSSSSRSDSRGGGGGGRNSIASLSIPTSESDDTIEERIGRPCHRLSPEEDSVQGRDRTNGTDIGVPIARSTEGSSVVVAEDIDAGGNGRGPNRSRDNEGQPRTPPPPYAE